MSRGHLRQAIFLLLSVFLIVAAIQYGSVYLEALKFGDFVEQEVKFAAKSRRSLEDVAGNIAKESQELGIGLTPRDVHISRKGISFTVSVSYTQPVDMFFFQHTLEFNFSKTGEIFDR